MNTPTEYFGPHAKRWTHPRTGVTYSVKPRDYHQLVAEQEEIREEELRRLGQLKSRTVSEEAVAAITAREERLRDEAVSAAWDDKALDEGVVTIDRLGDPGAAPMAGMFKEQGGLVADGGFRVPEHQRYELEVESSPVTVPPELAGTYDAIVYGATRGGVKYPEMIDRNQAETKEILAKVNDDLSAMTVDGSNVVQRGTVRFLSLSEDDRFGLIRPVEQSAPGEPAARHFRRRPSARNMVRLGLVYIIAIIGVISVAGVIS